jgi:hypothetical protein
LVSIGPTFSVCKGEETIAFGVCTVYQVAGTLKTGVCLSLKTNEERKWVGVVEEAYEETNV